MADQEFSGERYDTGGNLSMVVFGNGVFVAISGANLVASVTGDGWIQVIADVVFPSNVSNLVFTGKEFFCNSGSSLYRSIDGYYWTFYTSDEQIFGAGGGFVFLDIGGTAWRFDGAVLSPCNNAILHTTVAYGEGYGTWVSMESGKLRVSYDAFATIFYASPDHSFGNSSAVGWSSTLEKFVILANTYDPSAGYGEGGYVGLKLIHLSPTLPTELAADLSGYGASVPYDFSPSNMAIGYGFTIITDTNFNLAIEDGETHPVYVISDTPPYTKQSDVPYVADYAACGNFRFVLGSIKSTDSPYSNYPNDVTTLRFSGMPYYESFWTDFNLCGEVP